ncbi:SdpI family protein [Serpentinicella alkaliphila]|uniref:Putative membrane protein n=1 Tax=Serpentinicella alkaliphila TaxID=1734049 RepID=A0A4R2U233_9FIRM|nr:SdpI family protein [Serpentinicella alkaliphila]QUH26232.1 SdpI family protein [Serpentinicella alkaliphila]TCQ01693.1 putative membrane protein [Serpentinicella alkaliphila]
MKKKNKLILIALGISPFLLSALTLPILPHTIPKIINIGTEAYASKYELLTLPIFALIFAFFMYIVISKSDNRNYKAFYISTLALLIFINIYNIMLIYRIYLLVYEVRNVLSSEIVFTKVIMIFCSLLLMLIGNYLPKSKQNLILGIRTKWTLSNEEVWFLTHRFAAKIIIVFGFFSIIVSLLISNPKSEVFLIRLYSFFLIAPLIISAIYSKIIYDKVNKKNK